MHPPPIVRARPAEASELPRTAASLMKRATEAGWVASASYARGTTIDRFGEPGKVVDSIIVRLTHARGQARAAAIWIDGKATTAFMWATWWPLEQVGVRAISGWVSSVTQIAGRTT